MNKENETAIYVVSFWLHSKDKGSEYLYRQINALGNIKSRFNNPSQVKIPLSSTEGAHHVFRCGSCYYSFKVKSIKSKATSQPKIK